MQYLGVIIYLLVIYNVVGKIHEDDDWSNTELPVCDGTYNETLSPIIESIWVLSACSINITWSCRRCRHVEHFVIQINVTYGGTQVVGKDVFFYTITGLAPYTIYGIIISAIYEDNSCYSSIGHPAITEHSDPPDIDYINIEIITSTTIKLSWNTTNQECPIEKYDVQYSGPVLCTAGRTDSGGEITSETSTTLTGLIPYTEYNITIAAIATDDTYGNVNFMEDVITDEDAPGTPDKLVSVPLNSSSVQVSWDQPLECNGILLNYTVSWKLAEDDIIVGSDTTPELTYQVNNLLECGDYEFFVNASTSKGIGNAATTSSSTLPEVPPAPKITRCEAINSTTVELKWNASITLCPVTYDVTVNGTILWNGTKTYFASYTDDLNMTVSNLVPYSEYIIFVLPNTAIGVGEPGICHLATEEDVASSPVSLSVEASSVTSTSFSISWLESEEKNGVLKGFNATLDNGMSQYVPYTKPDDSYQVDFTGLEPATNYTISVYAENGAGYGNPSVIYQVTNGASGDQYHYYYYYQ